MSLISKISELRGGIVIPSTRANWTPPAMATPNGSYDELPFPTYQFSVEIDGVVVALFQKFTGMEIKRETVGLTEGGRNEHTLEFPGQVSYGHVTLESGQSSSKFFWDWMMAGQYAGWSKVRNFTVAQRKPSKDATKYWEVGREWFFINAFPAAWKISDFDVSDSKSIIIESLELSFDYFWFE